MSLGLRNIKYQTSVPKEKILESLERFKYDSQ